MPPGIPRPEKIREFADRESFERWLSTHHDEEDEVWLKVRKKSSGLASVTIAEALDVVLWVPAFAGTTLWFE